MLTGVDRLSGGLMQRGMQMIFRPFSSSGRHSFFKDTYFLHAADRLLGFVFELTTQAKREINIEHILDSILTSFH